MTIHFKSVSADDGNLVNSYISQDVVMNCDFSITNLFGWQFLYNTELAEVEGFLVIRFRVNGHLCYMLPMGQGNFANVIERLKSDADTFQEPLLIMGASQEVTKSIDQFLPGCFRFVPDRDIMDYVYLTTDLAGLNGRKFQSKRNHINKFKNRFPDYIYSELTKEHVADCLQMEALWVVAKGGRAQNALEAERTMMSRVLKNMEKLGVRGGVLYVGDKLVAFTFGSRINAVTFDVCVEKADKNYPGAYSVINNEFCLRLSECYKYVNREEDLGIEGLRKAKLSYQPVLLLEKLTALPVCCDSECWEVKKIYIRSFQDEIGYVDFYFKNRYTALNTVTMRRDQTITAAMQILDYSLSIWGEQLQTGYLSAACTMPEYRRQGIMSELFSKAHRFMFTKGKDISALIPANENLWKYYSKSGYVPGFYIETREKKSTLRNTSEFLNYEGLLISEPSVMDESLYTFIDTLMRKRDNCILHSLGDMTVVLSYYRKFNGIVITAMRNGMPAGILFGRRQDGRNDTLIVDDCLYEEDVVKATLFAEAKKRSGCKRILATLSVIDNPKRLGMIRIVNAQSVLSLYAEANPNENFSFVLTDSSISENDGYYSIKSGVCDYSPLVPDSVVVERIDIGQLSERIFSSCALFMSLMLND